MFTEDGYAGDEESIYKLKKWGVGEGSLNDTIFIATAVPLLVLHLYTFFARACLKIKNCTKHVFLSPFHDRIKKKGAFICQDVMN